MSLRIETDPQAAGLPEAWQSAEPRKAFHVGALQDYLERDSGASRIAMTDGDPVLPFLRQTYTYKFTVGERRVGALELDALVLANPWIAEGQDVEVIAKLLAHSLSAEGADAISLGEIPEGSALRQALDHLPQGFRALRRGRKQSLRWLIRLPATFDAYLNQLSSGTRQSVRRKMRKLSKDFDVDLRIVSDARDVPAFLEASETISRLTYQWNVGQRLQNDGETTRRYTALAEAGRLRCYLLSLDGEPRAFLRGTLEGGLYHYETPGFDPAYSRNSIGLVILLEAIRDLIEATECEVFDFGPGGDESGYKASFGNECIPCNSWLVVRTTRAKGFALLLGETGLNHLKNAADRLVPKGEMRARLKRALRRYGD